MNSIHGSAARPVMLVATAVFTALGVGLAPRADTFPYNLSGPNPGVSLDGTHEISLPVSVHDPLLTNCGELLSFIPNATSLSRFDRTTNMYVNCACPGPNCFSITPGIGYRVQVSANSSFSLEGQDGTLAIALDASAPSLDGTNLVSLPFSTTLSNASQLVADIGGFSPGPVVNVQRFDTSNNGFTAYTGGRSLNFPIVDGAAYRVRVSQDVLYTAPASPAGNSCSTSTSCTFQGLQNTALGNASLAIDTDGNLLVSNLVASGDGVEVTNPESPLRSGHEDWIPLGVVGFQPIAVENTATGSTFEFRSFATLTSGSPAELTLRIQEIAGNVLQVSTGFGDAGATSLDYELWDRGQRVTTVTAQPLDSTVTAPAWPSRQGFSFVQWAGRTPITLPTLAPQNGDEVHIIPRGPLDRPVSVQSLTVTRTVQMALERRSTRGAPLTSITINQELFGPAFTLSVSRVGSGSGTVTSVPAGINCGGDCSQNYLEDTQVTLIATPAGGSVFAGWSGDADCTDGVVTMTGSRSCIATFNAVFTLSVSRVGTGSGAVSSSPAGINCGGDCSESYASGTSVTLTPTPAGGSVFAGWSGHADCADGMVTMTGARSCTATFNTTGGTSFPDLTPVGMAVLVLLLLATLVGVVHWLRRQASTLEPPS